MRVISGSARGRRLLTPKGMRIRPTADRVKEALFNILASMLDTFDGLRVMDIFAGTGNLGIEALSRGAASAVFIENHRESVALITRNLQLTKFTSASTIIQKNAASALDVLSGEGKPFQLIFLDPPYGQGLAEQTLKLLGTSPLIADGTVVVAEVSLRESLSPSFGVLHEKDRRVYGDTVLSILIATKADVATVAIS